MRKARGDLHNLLLLCDVFDSFVFFALCVNCWFAPRCVACLVSVNWSTQLVRYTIQYLCEFSPFYDRNCDSFVFRLQACPVLYKPAFIIGRYGTGTGFKTRLEPVLRSRSRRELKLLPGAGAVINIRLRLQVRHRNPYRNLF